MIIFKLDKLLADRHLSKIDLVYRTGLPLRTIQAIYENKANDLSTAVLEKICVELDCTPDEIMECRW